MTAGPVELHRHHRSNQTSSSSTLPQPQPQPQPQPHSLRSGSTHPQQPHRTLSSGPKELLPSSAAVTLTVDHDQPTATSACPPNPNLPHEGEAANIASSSNIRPGTSMEQQQQQQQQQQQPQQPQHQRKAPSNVSRPPNRMSGDPRNRAPLPVPAGPGAAQMQNGHTRNMSAAAPFDMARSPPNPSNKSMFSVLSLCV